MSDKHVYSFELRLHPPDRIYRRCGCANQGKGAGAQGSGHEEACARPQRQRWRTYE